ncbi:MAG: flippase [Chitinophagales bacterium]|nr:flippase [Chitinophagales bacterium]MCZ2394250.1 flippase [Chitinophagales bacterium]
MPIKKIQNKIENALKDPNFSFVATRSLHTLLSMGAIFFLRFVSGVIIARVYGPEVSGWLTNLMTFMAAFIILGNFGIKDAMLKLIPEYREKYNLATAWAIYKKSLHLIAFFWLICMLIMYFIAEWQSKSWNVPHLKFFFQASGFFLIFLLMSEYNNFVLRAILQIKSANYNNIITLISRVVVIILLTLFLLNDYNPLYLQFISGCLLAWLFSQLSIHKHFKKPSSNQEVLVKIDYSVILAVAFPMLFTYLGFFINNFADAYMLPFYTSTELVGIYKTCGNVASIAAMGLVAMNTTIQPKISQLYHQGKHEEVMKLCVKFARLIFLMNIPIFAMIIFGSKLMIYIAYGEKFLPGALALSIIAIGQIFNVACGPVAQLLNVSGYHKQFRNISLIGAFINLTLIIFFIPKWGIEGAAIGNAVSMAAWNIIGTLYIKKKFGYYIAYIPFINLNKNIIHNK